MSASPLDPIGLKAVHRPPASRSSLSPSLRAFPKASVLLRGLLLHTLCGGWIGFTLGVADAMLASGGESWLVRGWAALAGAGVGAAVGGLGGALIGVVSALLGLAGGRLGVPVIGNGSRLSTARLLSLVLAGGTAFGVFERALAFSERIKVAPVRSSVLLLGAGVAIAVALFVAQALTPVLVGLTSRFRSLSRLQLLESRSARFMAFCAAPIVGVGLSLVASHGARLGVVRQGLWVVMFFVLTRSTFLWLTTGTIQRPVWVLSALILVTTTGAGMTVMRPESRELRVLSRAHIAPDALSVLHRISDVDRDGFSSLFGGRDCAPLDPARFPGARELPRNLVDEDCDGADASSPVSVAEVLPKFSSRPALGEQPFNVLWYIVDSLRADHLRIYGYSVETSPTLTALAEQSWVFERAYSQSSTTALSVPSMFSGRNPTALQWSSGVFPIASNEGFQLPRTFSSRGYLTALAINSWVKDRLPGIQYGFLHVLVSPPEVNWRSGDTLLSNVFQAVNEAQRAAKPFFIVAHVDDVHHPYTAAEGRTVPATSGLPELARYDAGIALFDQGLRITIEHLKRIGVWDRTVLIVNADHGEEFGEHGGAVHSRTCYSEVTHVPLLVRIPRAEARRISQPVALIDLAPTLLELLDARSSSVPLDGQSLFVPVHEPAAVDAERPIFCGIYQAMAGNPPQFTQSIRRGRWSFFQEAKTGRAELYDQIADPRERVNLSEAPERARDVRELERLLSSMPAGNLFRVVEGLE